MAGVSAYLYLNNKGVDIAKKALKLSIIVGLAASLLELFPFGHEHIVQVGKTQPEKLAAMEGLIDGQERAPLLLFGIPQESPEPDLKAKIALPGLLSLGIHGDMNAYVPGLKDFPRDEIPPFFLTLCFSSGLCFWALFCFIGNNYGIKDGF